MRNSTSPPKERAARESRRSPANELTETYHVSLNGTNGSVSSTTVVQPDANRVRQDLALEQVVLSGIMVNGPAPVEDAGIDLRPADFSNPDYGATFRWLCDNRGQWSHGYSNLVDIHNQLDKAGLAARLGQGSAGVSDLMEIGREIGVEVLKHRACELVDAGVERQRRKAYADYVNDQIAHPQLVELEADLSKRANGICSSGLPPFLTLQELDAAYPDDPPLLVAGNDPENERDGALLALGELGVLASTSKVGKTWTVIDAMLSVASGREWLGHFRCKRGRVLYVNMELGGRAFIRRAEMLMSKRGLKANDVSPSIRVWQLRNTRIAAVEELGDRIAASGEQFDLIILDPLYKLLGNREENSNGDMGELMQAVRERFCNGGRTAVLLVHHFPKGDPSKRASLDRLAGAGAIARDADTLITITPEGETFRLEATTRDYKSGSPLELKMDFPAVDVVGVAESMSPKAKAAANNEIVCDLVREESGLTRADLVKRVMAELCVGQSMAYKVVKAAEKARVIERTKLEKTYVAL